MRTDLPGREVTPSLISTLTFSHGGQGKNHSLFGPNICNQEILIDN